MLTAETITDQQIRELIDELRIDGKWTKRRGRLHWSRQEDLRACYAALSICEPIVSSWTKESARARCAEILNERAKVGAK